MNLKTLGLEDSHVKCIMFMESMLAEFLVQSLIMVRQVRLRCYTCVTFFGRYMYEYVIRLRVTDLA